MTAPPILEFRHVTIESGAQYEFGLRNLCFELLAGNCGSCASNATTNVRRWRMRRRAWRRHPSRVAFLGEAGPACRDRAAHGGEKSAPV